ncbi:RNA polymerase sigma factor [Parabacteroides sp. AM08-6]|uniref:RNA polymerase sigma factor n=1 Tax=Parabacteroides sp. AM08-6 TaxID=2292053 RepID=UPI000F000E08|nr:RNA polymerase sigma factor [Parabacteroides sp. AM08-6]RHJ81800.1 RNA polymerase sigma factor [Parabacteroides sp. AM08-6]
MELETFKITVLPLREKLFNISRKLTEDKADAEDIVQEAFLKLWSIREKLDGYQSVEALAIQVTKNLTIDKLRVRRPEGPDIETLALDSGNRSPAEELEQQDAVTRIRQLIEKLPSLQQTIIRMKDVEGYELTEIAEITGTQVEAVRVNLSRARKKIREQFLQLNKQMQR